MQKTKTGLSVGLMAAIVYFTGLFSNGLLVAVILAGYILLFEENVWLKKSAVKAVMVIILFTTLAVVINLIPDLISMISNIVAAFEGSFTIRPLAYIISAITIVINIIEKILLIVLGAKALKQSTIPVPIVNKMIEKYMG